MEPLSLFLLVAACGHLVLADLQCLDENNNPVDWYVLYKFPKMNSSCCTDGTGYKFITSHSNGWSSISNITSSESLLATTTWFLREKNNSIVWLSYNDQTSRVSWATTYGHTKGLVAGDKNGGLWLVHSIPHFVNGTYPKSALKFGQSAMCISLNKNDLNDVGVVLAYNRPDFHSRNFPREMKGVYVNLYAAFREHIKVNKPWIVNISIKTKGGQMLQAFGKNKRFKKDLYDEVASKLGTDLLVETWRHQGSKNLNSTCGEPYRVINIKSMYVPLNDGPKVPFHASIDHSKVAISNSTEKYWVCIGDINRTESQKARGGGTVCIENQKLWELYHQLIHDTEHCP